MIYYNREDIEWEKIIKKCEKNFIENHFNFMQLNHLHEVNDIVLNEFLPKHHIQSVSWGDSETLIQTGLLEQLQKMKNIHFIQTFDPVISEEEKFHRRREAFTADLFLTGSNALTEEGQLVNLDGTGNRIAPMIYGPKYVMIVTGKNKIVANISEAFDRIRNYAAPLNAKRHNMNTPCVKTGKCMDCRSSERICNAWSIIEKSNPPGRITILLVKGDFGL